MRGSDDRTRKIPAGKTVQAKPSRTGVRPLPPTGPHRRSGAAAPAPGPDHSAGRDVITRAVIASGSVGVAWGRVKAARYVTGETVVLRWWRGAAGVPGESNPSQIPHCTLILERQTYIRLTHIILVTKNYTTHIPGNSGEEE